MNIPKRIALVGPFILSTAWLLSTCASAQPQTDRPLVYPETKTVDVVENLHGVQVADPYRWMENLDAPEIKAWIEAQNELTFGYLRGIPQREAIRRRLTELWNYERFGLPYKRGDRYFFQKNAGLQNQAVLYVTESLDAEARVLLNPNELSADGTIALTEVSISDDGKLMAYGLSEAGSDWVECRVREIDTGRDLPDHLKWTKFPTISWTKDNRGLFYTRFDEPQGNELQDVTNFPKLCYHRLGTPQAEDRLVFHAPDQKDWIFVGGVTDDGRYLIITIGRGTDRMNLVYYVDLEAGGDQAVKLIDAFDAQYGFIDNDGPVFWFYTDWNAPRGRVVAIDIRTPGRESWREIIPQATSKLQGVAAINNMFVAVYLEDARSQIKILDLDGHFVRDLVLPGIGSAGGFPGRRSDTETFYAFTSFAYPTTIYRYDMATGASTVFKRPQVDFDPDQYVTEQVFYPSKDGTKVPMFLAHRKDLELDGSNPIYLYAYGGGGISFTPYFSISNLVWMEMGGVYALANIRGGGEYGVEWHEAGRLKNKQNCFDDFIAAGEWLIANNYTSRDKLAIGGGSNGGLLVGACLTQRPDLFGAALPECGVLDMLRFHKYTVGWAWVFEYGSPDDPEMFKVLRAYSPLHNVRPGTRYPATLITTADHDDRVVPSHSFKFTAALQKAQAADDPVLIRVETRAGHGAGKPMEKIIAEVADQWAFLARTLHMQLPASY